LREQSPWSVSVRIGRPVVYRNGQFIEFVSGKCEGLNMLLTYVDETKDDAYFVNALVIEPSEVPILSEAINRFKLLITSRYGISDDIEFHGYEIFHGKKQWHFINGDYAAQKSIYLEFLKLVISHTVEIYIKGIEVDGFEKVYGNQRHIIHNAAMTWNLEKVQKRALEKGSYALVISDEVNSHTDYYRAYLRYHQQNPTFGWQSIVLDRIVDTLHFAPSRESLMIQAIDMISYAHLRSRCVVNNPELSEFQKEMWGVIRDSGKVAYFGIWHPPDKTSN
jgi:hypothetical protein